MLQQVGYFSDHLFRAAEETDFALNYLMAGYQMWYLSGALIHHMPSVVRSKEEVSFYKCRNEIMIIFERYPVLLILPFIAWTVVSQIKSGIQKPSHLPYIIKGFFSGLTKALECLSNRKPISLSIIRQVRFSPMHGSKIAQFLAGQP